VINLCSVLLNDNKINLYSCYCLGKKIIYSDAARFPLMGPSRFPELGTT